MPSETDFNPFPSRYNPSYAHPISQPFLPPELASSANFLEPEDSLKGKTYDEAALREWEWKVQGGAPWEGRKEMMEKLEEIGKKERDEAEVK